VGIGRIAMSLFWKYFREKLRWPLIWRPGVLAVLVKGGALVLDDARESILWLRNQFSPEICNGDHVANFAKSRGILRHALETDNEKFRQRVISAYAWQMFGGRAQGLPKILGHYGYKVNKLINLRDEDPNRWAEFRAEVQPPEGKGFEEKDFNLVPFVINDQKPARSKLDAVIMHVDTQSRCPHVGIGMVCGETITVYPWSQTETELSRSVPHVAIGWQAVETITVYPLEA